MSTLQGKVKWFNGKKGYGFIERDDKEKDAFVHASAVKAAGMRFLNEGDKLEFTLEDGPKGPSAVNLKKIDSPTDLVGAEPVEGFKKIKHQRLGIWVLVLSLLFAVQSWLYVEAVKYMSVGLASVVLFTYPLLTYLIVSITKKRSLDLTTVLMFLIAIVGIAAISQSDEGFYTMVIGIILALLSALSYSLILIRIFSHILNLKTLIQIYTQFLI